jgi:hypothetical protein
MVEVWKENVRSGVISNQKEFRNDFDGAWHAYRYARYLMRNEPIIN